jgi:DNA-binding IclR family transcriptional regulator
MIMPCIDADGNITRSAELLLLAMKEPATIEETFKESGLPLFKVRSGVRELHRAGLLEKLPHDRYQITVKGFDKLEGR